MSKCCHLNVRLRGIALLQIYVRPEQTASFLALPSWGKEQRTSPSEFIGLPLSLDGAQGHKSLGRSLPNIEALHQPVALVLKLVQRPAHKDVTATNQTVEELEYWDDARSELTPTLVAMDPESMEIGPVEKSDT